MGNFDHIKNASSAGYKKGQEIARRDAETGQKTSLGKTMAEGAMAGLKESGPGILRNLLRTLLR